MNVDELLKKLEDGVYQIFESGAYKEYLDSMSKFHQYSLNNQMLIYLQNPNATFVAGYKNWEKQFERHVQSGEKAIRILAPCMHLEKKEIEENGEIVEVIEKNVRGYKIAYVFDVSQTQGKDIPQIVNQLKSNVTDYDVLYCAISSISPVPIIFSSEIGSANGYYSPSKRQIVIKRGIDFLMKS